MNEKRYVQYKNDPSGTKWELAHGSYNESLVATNWRVRAEDDFHYLPKTDYILCPPPERWTDVTAECRLTDGIWPATDGTSNAIQRDAYILWRSSSHASGYRLRKVHLWNEHAQHSDMLHHPQWAFIVEKREES